MEKLILEFKTDRNVDPHRSNLRGVLETQFSYERMSAARSLFVHLLAIVGGVIWLQAIWPTLLSEEVRLFILVLWAALLFSAILAAVEEHVSRRKLKHLLAAKKGVMLTKGDELF